MKTKVIYFQGNAAEYTGQSQFLHGQVCYGYRLMEGHRIGEVIWSYTSPYPDNMKEKLCGTDN